MVNENRHFINRKKILLDKEQTIASIAAAIGYTRQSVYMAIKGHPTSYKLHKKIADLLEVVMVDFWPELYGDVNKFSHDAIVNESFTGVN